MMRPHSIEQRIEIVLSIISENLTEQEAASRYGVSEADIKDWKAFYASSVRHSMHMEKRERFRMTAIPRVRVIAAVIALIVLGAAAVAATPAEILTCVDSNNFFCFSPNTPAKSSEVNHNFAKMGKWVQNAVGPMSALIVDSSTAGLTQINGDVSAGNIEALSLSTTEQIQTTGALSAGSIFTEGELTAASISIGSTPLSTYIRDYIRDHCKLYLGWKDDCNENCLLPSKSGWTTPNNEQGCDKGTSGDDSSCSEGWLGINTDGDVNDDDKFFVKMECD